MLLGIMPLLAGSSASAFLKCIADGVQKLVHAFLVVEHHYHIEKCKGRADEVRQHVALHTKCYTMYIGRLFRWTCGFTILD